MIIMSKNTAKATSNPKRPGRPLVPGSANWLKKYGPLQVQSMNNQLKQVDTKMTVLNVVRAPLQEKTNLLTPSKCLSL